MLFQPKAGPHLSGEPKKPPFHLLNSRTFGSFPVNSLTYHYPQGWGHDPLGSMYCVYTYIYQKNQPNVGYVGKYTIHGSYGRGLAEFAKFGGVLHHKHLGIQNHRFQKHFIMVKFNRDQKIHWSQKYPNM